MGGIELTVELILGKSHSPPKVGERGLGAGG